MSDAQARLKTTMDRSEQRTAVVLIIIHEGHNWKYVSQASVTEQAEGATRAYSTFYFNHVRVLTLLDNHSRLFCNAWTPHNTHGTTSRFFQAIIM